LAEAPRLDGADPTAQVLREGGAELVAFQVTESFCRGDGRVNLARDDLLAALPEFAAAASGDWRSFPSTQPIFYRRDRLLLLDEGWFFLSDTPDVIFADLRRVLSGLCLMGLVRGPADGAAPALSRCPLRLPQRAEPPALGRADSRAHRALDREGRACAARRRPERKSGQPHRPHLGPKPVTVPPVP